MQSKHCVMPTLKRLNFLKIKAVKIKLMAFFVLVPNVKRMVSLYGNRYHPHLFGPKSKMQLHHGRLDGTVK